uniref:Uncharacterized protein n=1 Tax=Rhizoctonia solani TaxID=456999 RepID=N0A6Z1_9AGAM|nr:hypothetical protein RSOL_m00820 [Rhizoctonia solani]AGK45406.1 hypothetical protein RSOL_m00820 [Rhizoctonia solani]
MNKFLVKHMVDHLLKNSQNKSEDYINQLHELNTDFNNVQERYFNECFELQKTVDLQDKAKYEMSCKAFEEIQERYRAYPGSFNYKQSIFYLEFLGVYGFSRTLKNIFLY